MQTNTPVVQLAACTSNAEDLAAQAVARWRQLDGALVPIFGRRGLGAIYARALEIASADHPWLILADGYRTAFDNFIPLQKALAGQTTKRAAAGNLAFYQCFRKLLASLIGQPLTARLLLPVANHADAHLFRIGPRRLHEINP